MTAFLWWISVADVTECGSAEEMYEVNTPATVTYP